MAKKYEISEEGLNELREARRTNRDKSVERRLHALILHAEGNKGKKVSELTGYNEKYLYKLYRKYLSGGIEAITGNHYGGNRRNMSYEEEEIFLSQFINRSRWRSYNGCESHKSRLRQEGRTRNRTWSDILCVAPTWMVEEAAPKQTSKECKARGN